MDQEEELPMPAYTWNPGVLGFALAIGVIVTSLVFAITGQLEPKVAGLFVACGLLRLL